MLRLARVTTCRAIANRSLPVDRHSAGRQASDAHLGAIAEFERERIRERVLAGLQRARAQGRKLGRPQARPPIDGLQRVAGLSVHVAAERLGVSRSTVKRWRRLNRSATERT
jgi:putative DNA-invertase from lambdoid prophage Rac